jgi:hypothetical protein
VYTGGGVLPRSLFNFSDNFFRSVSCYSATFNCVCDFLSACVINCELFRFYSSANTYAFRYYFVFNFFNYARVETKGWKNNRGRGKVDPTFFVDVVGQDGGRWTQRLQRKGSVARRIPRRRSPTSLVSIQQTELIVYTVVSGRNRRILGRLLFLCGQISQNPVYRRDLKHDNVWFLSFKKSSTSAVFSHFQTSSFSEFNKQYTKNLKNKYT